MIWGITEGVSPFSVALLVPSTLSLFGLLSAPTPKLPVRTIPGGGLVGLLLGELVNIGTPNAGFMAGM